MQEILSRFVDVERAVNQCVVVPKNPSPSFVEQRINAVVALRHILSLVAPLQAALAKANSPLIVSLAKVTHFQNSPYFLFCNRKKNDRRWVA